MSHSSRDETVSFNGRPGYGLGFMYGPLAEGREIGYELSLHMMMHSDVHPIFHVLKLKPSVISVSTDLTPLEPHTVTACLTQSSTRALISTTTAQTITANPRRITIGM